jgi:hypothetical protein
VLLLSTVVAAVYKSKIRSLRFTTRLLHSQIKNAIVKQSRTVFGQQLSADPCDDIKLKSSGSSEVLGDIDTLLTGPSLHVHVERKRRIISAADAAGVVYQMKQTELAYKFLRRHIVGDTCCRFKQVVFAESMEPGASSQFLEAGIYVLTFTDMLLQSPG